MITSLRTLMMLTAVYLGIFFTSFMLTTYKLFSVGIAVILYILMILPILIMSVAIVPLVLRRYIFPKFTFFEILNF